MTAVPAAVLGVVLATAAAACQPPNGGGSKSNAEVCSDMDDQIPYLVAGIVSSSMSLGFYQGGVDDMSADDQATVLNQVHASYSDLSGALRSEADLADDADMAATLNATADDVDAQGARIKTVRDVAAMGADSVDVSRLYSHCPGMNLDLKSG